MITPEIRLLILGIMTLIFGFCDEMKYYWQFKKIQITRRTGGVSRRMLLTSVATKSFVLYYALYTKTYIFAVLYVIGLITSFMALKILYDYSKIRDKSVLNFVLKSFHIKIVKTKKENYDN